MHKLCHPYFRPFFGDASQLHGRVACLRCYLESSWISGPPEQLSPEIIASGEWGIDTGHDLCHYANPQQPAASS